MIDKRKDLPCAVVRDLLPLYHDGVVSSDTSDLIEAHLEGCENCRNELNSIHCDETIEGNLIEQDKNAYFKEFRDGVKSLRRNGTIRGLIIAAVAMVTFLGGIAFLSNETVIKIGPDDLQIDDVCRCNLGANGGDAIAFTYNMDWYGSYSITFKQNSDPGELNILIKRTALGGKMEKDERNNRNFYIADDYYKDIFDLTKIKTIKVNDQVIWTKDQGVNNDPPEYIGELRKTEYYDESLSPERRAISYTISDDVVSVIYEDNHGVRWDKDGNVIARFTVDENENIISMESVPSNEKGN